MNTKRLIIAAFASVLLCAPAVLVAGQPQDSVADAAKKACGGGVIYKGHCQGEEAKMVFSVGVEVPAGIVLPMSFHADLLQS